MARRSPRPRNPRIPPRPAPIGPGENSRDFPDPDWAKIAGKNPGIPAAAPLPDFPGIGKSGNPDLAGIGKIAGICASITGMIGGIRIGIGTQDSIF